MNKLLKILDKNLIEITFFVSAAAVCASMILSLAAGLEPCTLCWYQRMLLFPVPLILLVGALRKDKFVMTYILPFLVLGLIIAGYHTLLQWGFIEEALKTCSATGPACDEPEIKLLGFLTIPFGSFLSFATVAALAMRQIGNVKNKLGIAKDQDRLLGYMLLALALGTGIAFVLVRQFFS